MLSKLGDGDGESQRERKRERERIMELVSGLKMFEVFLVFPHVSSSFGIRPSGPGVDELKTASAGQRGAVFWAERF